MAHLERSAMKLKISACLAILLYGSLLTLIVVFLQAFGSAMSGMSASSTGRNSTLWSVWPTPVFFILSATAPFLAKGRKRSLLVGVALGLVIVPSIVMYGIADGLLFAAILSVAALPVWIPLLGRFAEPSQLPDGGLR
jgi:hypothetical protein